MEVLVIGKPAINVYLPLQEFPQEGDVFNITGKTETLGGITAVSACLLAKWGVKPHYTGVLGNDAFGEKVRNVFSEYKVNSKFLETTFEKSTATNYMILNMKTGDVTKILFNDPSIELQKFKYDFQPDWAIMDSTDTAGSMALLNNDGRVKTVFYARIADQNTQTLAKRCRHVICTQAFFEGVTKVKINPEDGNEVIVNAYQKLVDEVGKNNYIVILNNKKILYSEDNKVKMIPEMKINHSDVSSFDSVFTGSFTFAMMYELSLDDAIKFANTAAAISISRIGEEPAIPTLEEVLDNSGLKDKLKSYKPQETTTTEAPQEVEEAPKEEVVPQAFNQQPIQEPVAPVEQAQTVAAEPVQQQPVQQPAEVVQPPQHEETNIFG